MESVVIQKHSQSNANTRARAHRAARIYGPTLREGTTGMSNEKSKSVSDEEMLRMTTSVVSAYVGNNSLTPTQIPDVIKTVYGSLTSLGRGGSARDMPRPAVPIRRSITPDYIVCLEDGRKLKMLKRHLRTTY